MKKLLLYICTFVLLLIACMTTNGFILLLSGICGITSIFFMAEEKNNINK